ncbi:MAG: ABC transporter ATP-binding protein [Clostridiales bacterium]|nr:ABC transporter ATP-binding protein [Clostridiales bacterium]
MIEVKNLSFRYEKDPIIEDISFCARPGEITAVVGANGAGKTTLLKCIAGLEKGTGTVNICGKDTGKLSRSKISKLLSYLDQSTDCSAELNVYEVILLGRLQQLSFKVSDEDIERVDEVMEMMSLTQFADRRISELSGGQRQLVFIAQTLIKNPQILILDEPTSALDLNHQFKIMEFLKSVTKEKHYTTLLTLHHLDIAAKYADHVVVINDRKVYTEDSPDKVFTEKMLRDVYEVNAEIYVDSMNDKHIVALGSV